MTTADFETLARRLRPSIVSRITRLTRDADLADDIAQDTLLRLWQMRQRLPEYRSVDALAGVMSRNLALDALRRRGSTVSIDALATDLPESFAAEADAALLDAEAMREADALLATLAPAQQAVMRMRHSEGMEMEEIARVTGTTAANIRVILCRARAKVKEMYLRRS